MLKMIFSVLVDLIGWLSEVLVLMVAVSGHKFLNFFSSFRKFIFFSGYLVLACGM